jgi:hypothetical protein
MGRVGGGEREKMGRVEEDVIPCPVGGEVGERGGRR